MRAVAPSVLLALTVTALPARAQVRSDAAATIRVVEYADPGTGRRERTVVDDLTPAEVLQVQRALGRAGYEPGVRTGALGPATRRALSRFQAARGLRICGCVSYETVIALGIVPEVVGRDGYGRSPGPPSVIVVVPGRDGHRRGRGPESGIVVGLGGPSGVAVGHAPAAGAGRHGGRIGRHRPRRPLPPPAPGPGGRIRPGPGARPH